MTAWLRGTAALVVLCLPVASASALEVRAPDGLMEGIPALVVPDPGAVTLHIVWAPESRMAHTEVRELPGGPFSWTPDRTGLARLQTMAADGTPLGDAQTVMVRWRHVPWSALVVLLLAGGVLSAITALGLGFGPSRKRP